MISPPGKLPDANGDYLVVPTSKSSLSRYAASLPNRAPTPQTTSGLPDPCKAVCDEYKLVKPQLLTKWVGDLRTPMISKLQELVLAFLADQRQTKQGHKPEP